MHTNLLKYSLVLGTFLLLTYGFSCDECEDEFNETTSVFIDILGRKDFYIVGDTILLSCQFDSEPLLEPSQLQVSIANELFRVGFVFNKLIKNQYNYIDGIKYFEILPSNGDIFSSASSSGVDILVSNTCTEITCEMEVGIIPKETGTYVITPRFGEVFTADECNDIDINPFEYRSEELNYQVFEELGGDFLYINGETIPKLEIDQQSFFFIKVE